MSSGFPCILGFNADLEGFPFSCETRTRPISPSHSLLTLRLLLQVILLRLRIKTTPCQRALARGHSSEGTLLKTPVGGYAPEDTCPKAPARRHITFHMQFFFNRLANRDPTLLVSDVKHNYWFFDSYASESSDID